MSLRNLLSVDRRMIPAKVACLLAYGILGSYLPYFNIFFISLGLSKFNAGIITGLAFLPPIVAGPLWGYLGDVTGRRRTILVVLCLGSAVLMFSTPYLASNIYPKSKFNMTKYESCYDTIDKNTFFYLPRYHRYLDTSETLLTNASINAEQASAGRRASISATVMMQTTTPLPPHTRTNATTTIATTTAATITTAPPLDCEAFFHHLSELFWVLLPLMLIASIFLVPLQPYMEAIVMEIVKTGTPGTTYGTQRIFGAVGLCLANFGAGKAAYYFQVPKDMSEYTAVFFIFLPCTVLLIPVGCYMIGQLEDTKASHIEDVEMPHVTTNRNHGNNNNEEQPRLQDPKLSDSMTQASKHPDLPDITKNSNSDSVSTKTDDVTAKVNNREDRPLKLVLKLCCRFEVAIFLVTVLVSGLAASVFLTFSYVYTKETLHKGYTEMTMVIVTANIAETIIFPFTGKLIRLLRGPRVAIVVGLLAHSVRFFFMAQDVSFGVFVGVQSLSALAFAVSFAAMMEETHRISPDVISVTMVTVVTTTFFIVATFVANIAGSLIYDRYGGQKLFLWQSWLCAGWCVALVSYETMKKCKSREVPRDSNTEPRDDGSNHGDEGSTASESCQYYHNLGAHLP